jgi:hypothetical protein
MDSLTAIVDRSLAKMKPHDLWSWDKMGTDIFNNGEVPARKTYAYQKWIELRNAMKKRINRELAHRNRPERLICAGQGKGVYLINEEDVAQHCSEKHLRRAVTVFEGGKQEFDTFTKAVQVSLEDKKAMRRLSVMFELQCNTMLGSVANMKSLPAPIKKYLLKKLGLTKKKKGHSK